MADRPYNVLFLCTGNTARSILAEGILRKDGAGRFNAFSAGSQPKGTVNPFALKVLRQLRLPNRGLPLEELGRIRRARRARDGFHLHRLRQRRGREPVRSGLAIRLPPTGASRIPQRSRGRTSRRNRRSSRPSST